MLLAVRISSYGCTWEVWRAPKKLELLLRFVFCSSNFPRASITLCTHAKHEPILELKSIDISKQRSTVLRAIAYKYRESHDRKENSDFLLLRQKKNLLVSYFQKHTFKVPENSHFCEIQESSKYGSINQDGRWNLPKIVHFQHASTERRELPCISYSHGL